MRGELAVFGAAILVMGSLDAGGQGPPAPAQGSAPVTIGGDVQAPVKTRDVSPVYPPDAQARGIAGVVIVEIIVGVDGKVTEARVVRSIPELDEAALTAVRQWEFAPTLLNGKPTPIRMTVTIRFSLGPDAPQGAEASSSARVDRTPDCLSQQPTPAALARREQAVRFVTDVNDRQRRAAIESQSRQYRPWEELPGRPSPPDGFDVQMIASGAAYSVALTSSYQADDCRFGVFSDQRGVVYLGVAVP